MNQNGVASERRRVRPTSVTASVLTNTSEGLALTFLFDNEPEPESVSMIQRFRDTAVLVRTASVPLEGH